MKQLEEQNKLLDIKIKELLRLGVDLNKK